MGARDVLAAVDAGGDSSELEALIARALFELDIWSSPRASARIASFRVRSKEAARVRVCGRIRDIDQTERSFWLDVERDGSAPDKITWTLHFDVDPTSMSPRRARHATAMTQATWPPVR